MSIRGITRNIALTPHGYKNLDPLETFVPRSIDIRNGFLTDAGFWHKRHGIASTAWRDISLNESMNLLIPTTSVGYGITESGRIFSLDSTPVEFVKRLTGTERPQWDIHNDMIIVVDGGRPVKIASATSALLGGSPPKAKYIARITDYTLLAGHDDTQIDYCAANNPESWPGNNFNVKKEGQKVMNIIEQDGKLYAFKERNTDVFVNISGSIPFGVANTLKLDVGLLASYSLLRADSTLYWLGHDLDFYALDGTNPKVISRSYTSDLHKLNNPSEIYGIDFRMERKIRWFAPTDGKCYVYDYKNGIFSEDNTWDHGQWERLTINSYMELNNKQYIGDYDPTGKVYGWNKDNLDDAGKPIRVFREFLLRPFESGHRGRFNRMRLRIQRGVATSSVTSPLLTFRHKIDQGLWRPAKDFDLGSVGVNDPYITIHSLGIGREMTFQLIETDAVEHLITHADLTVMELGR